MIEYRLDPNNPPRLTAEEERRLERTPIDYSDIPKLDQQFFSTAKRTAAPRYLTHDDLAQDPWNVMRGLLPPAADIALLLAATNAARQVDGLILDAWRGGGFSKVTAWLLDLAHMSAVGRIAMLNDWRSRLTGTAFITTRPYGEDTSYARAMPLRPEHLREVIAIVNETAPPPLVPNNETIEAMQAAERGEVTTAGRPRKLLKSLNAH